MNIIFITSDKNIKDLLSTIPAALAEIILKVYEKRNKIKGGDKNS